MADRALSSDSFVTATARWIDAVVSADRGMNDSLAAALGGWESLELTPTSGQIDGQHWTLMAGAITIAEAPPRFYKMRGMDAITAGLYDTWVVTGDPDGTGAHYGGTLNTPLRDVVVVDSWGDGAMPASHAAAHEHGGSQEINVGNLRGVLADPQAADRLITPVGILTMGASADGQVLARAGSDVVGRSIPYDFWRAPDVAHPNDQEFDSIVLPAQCQLWNITGTGSSGPHESSGNVDWDSAPAVGTVRMQANHPGRRGWLLLQPSTDTATRWFYGFPMTLGGENIFRCRLATHAKVGTYAANTALSLFAIIRDGGGRPMGDTEGGTAFGFRTGWWTDANGTFLRAWHRTQAGGTNTIVTSPDYDTLGAPTDLEIVFCKTGLNTWRCFVRSPGISWIVWDAVVSGSFLQTGSPIWVGIIFSGSVIERPYTPILAVDYFRQADSAASFVP